MSATGDLRPLHQQLKERLRQRILSGTYEVGERIPSSSEMMEQEGVSLITIRRAVTDLIKEGLLRGVQGKGTYVIRRSIPPALPIRGLLAFVHGFELGNPLFQNIFHAAERELRQAGYTLIFVSSRENSAEEVRILLELRARGIRGALLVPYGDDRQPEDEETLLSLPGSGFPLVLIDQRPAGLPLDLVASDNRGLACQGTEYLLGLGHRRIGFVMGPDLSSTRQRMDGYREALAAAGIAFAPELIWKGALDIPCLVDGGMAAEHLLALRTPPTAIFCTMDALAFGAAQHCAEKGIAVPQKLSILGVDNLPLCLYATPHLSTLEQDTEGMGQRAAQLLLARLQGSGGAVEEVHLPGRLIERDSCARIVRTAASSAEMPVRQPKDGAVRKAARAGSAGPSAGFTLVELLVVIAIIGILAALLMPALQRGLNAARQTTCANNIRQISVAQNMYADDYAGIVWYHASYSGTLTDAWSEAISGGNYYKKTAYIKRDNVFCCPSSSVTVYQWNTYTYGMYNANVDSWRTARGYNFFIRLNLATFPSYFYRRNSFPSPSGFVVFGDSLCVTHPNAANVGKPFYQWTPTGFVEGAGLHMLHDGFSTAGFADGHVAAMNPFALRNTYSGIKCTIDSFGNKLVLP